MKEMIWAPYAIDPVNKVLIWLDMSDTAKSEEEAIRDAKSSPEYAKYSAYPGLKFFAIDMNPNSDRGGHLSQLHHCLEREGLAKQAHAPFVKAFIVGWNDILKSA